MILQQLPLPLNDCQRKLPRIPYELVEPPVLLREPEQRIHAGEQVEEPPVQNRHQLFDSRRVERILRLGITAVPERSFTQDVQRVQLQRWKNVHLGATVRGQFTAQDVGFFVEYPHEAFEDLEVEARGEDLASFEPLFALGDEQSVADPFGDFVVVFGFGGVRLGVEDFLKLWAFVDFSNRG